MRDSIGYSAYYRENRFVRELHHELSGARDREVLCQSLEEIARFIEDTDISRRILTIKEKEENKPVKSQERPAKEKYECIEADIGQMIERLSSYRFSKSGFDIYAAGIRRMYRQSRGILNSLAKGKADPVMIHNFRKRAKYLMYQLDILKPIFKKVLKGMVGSMDDMTEKLGRCRDLILAYQHIRAYSGSSKLEPEQIRFIHEKTSETCNLLLKDALNTGKKVFAESPDKFVKRLEKYWETSVEHEIMTE